MAGSPSIQCIIRRAPLCLFAHNHVSITYTQKTQKDYYITAPVKVFDAN